MNRKFTVSLIMCVLLTAFAAPVYPWGYATHAYIADRVNKLAGDRNANEVYGSLAPDMFNDNFDLPVYEPGGIYVQFHHHFMTVWEQKKSGMEKGLALGFVSHNEQWGADRTAHIDGLTVKGQTGYVIARARLLGQVAPLPPELGVPPAVAEELYHTFVEYGLDVMTARIDPAIGDRISDAAIMRDDGFAEMLAGAYAEDFAPWFGGSEAAAAAIGFTEGEFRGTMILYGQILTMPEPSAVSALANYLAGFAMQYLEMYGVVLPEGMDVVGTIEFYLDAAIQICEADYPEELATTVEFVADNLSSEGIENSHYQPE